MAACTLRDGVNAVPVHTGPGLIELAAPGLVGVSTPGLIGPATAPPHPVASRVASNVTSQHQRRSRMDLVFPLIVRHLRRTSVSYRLTVASEAVDNRDTDGSTGAGRPVLAFPEEHARGRCP